MFTRSVDSIIKDFTNKVAALQTIAENKSEEATIKRDEAVAASNEAERASAIAAKLNELLNV